LIEKPVRSEKYFPPLRKNATQIGYIFKNEQNAKAQREFDALCPILHRLLHTDDNPNQLFISGLLNSTSHGIAYAQNKGEHEITSPKNFPAMNHTLLDLSQILPTFFMQNSGFLNGTFITLGTLGVMVGLLASGEPEDPTDI
jgi:hypothetical protein